MRFSLRPDQVFDGYEQIEGQELARRGIRLLLSDLDYTLAPKYVPHPDDRVREWLRRMEEGGVQVMILSNNRSSHRVETFCRELGIPYVEMDELLAKSDFVSVHAPAVDGGALISAENIAKMKDGVVVINTSRGTNVDEAALLAALESGKVRAAGLDVYADEPATNKALYSHPMVSCTPHIGAATVEAQKRIGAEIVDIIKAM